MPRLFKTWLILLLITAVPLQAAAAGTTRLCAPLAALPAAMTAHCQHDAAQSSAVPHSAGTPEENKTPAKHPACGAFAAMLGLPTFAMAALPVIEVYKNASCG